MIIEILKTFRDEGSISVLIDKLHKITEKREVDRGIHHDQPLEKM